MVKKQVLVAVTDGSEEIELVAPIDILRRADIDVTVASCAQSTTVTLAQGVKIVADAMIGDVRDRSFDCIVVPGGRGSTNLAESPALVAMLKTQQRDQRLIGAICAAPFTVLQKHGLLEDRQATCFPAFADRLHNYVTPEAGDPHDVVVSNRVISSRGPGTAIPFGLALAAALVGKAKARDVAQKLVAQFDVPSVCDVPLTE